MGTGQIEGKGRCDICHVSFLRISNFIQTGLRNSQLLMGKQKSESSVA